MTLKQRVRRRLKKLGLTQEAVASQLGISGASLSQILNGHRPASLDIAIRLSDLTNIPVRDFAEARQQQEVA